MLCTQLSSWKDVHSQHTDYSQDVAQVWDFYSSCKSWLYQPDLCKWIEAQRSVSPLTPLPEGTQSRVLPLWKELSWFFIHKTTFLEDISGWKDKNLPKTSKHYFKSIHPLFHTRGRDNLEHWSSHAALLISSLTARLELSDGTTWSSLYIPSKQQELAERDKQRHYPSALTQSHVKNEPGWMCCAQP